jgi:hygromycin-B 7''-O-kinase
MHDSYGARLGMITTAQFQAALDRFALGTFIRAAAIPWGNFGQNVFVTASSGEYVLRGAPHFGWHLPTEQWWAQMLHERTATPVPWPYLIDSRDDIFGWSYAIMPRLPGFQLADPDVVQRMTRAARGGVARALGRNLATMHELTWPFCGRFDAMTQRVELLELAAELTWPFPPPDSYESSAHASYGEIVIARMRHNLRLARSYNDHTTHADMEWVESIIAASADALDASFTPTIVMQDYKEGNIVVEQAGDGWRVSGVFDLMQLHFGDGEADLSRQTAAYLDEDLDLARAFLHAYLDLCPPRPGFTARFPLYMLDDLG